MQQLAVESVHFLAPDIFELTLKRGGVEYQPGDCLTLSNGGSTGRPYSITSNATGKALTFLIRKMPGGEVSEWLAERQPGDGITVSPPFGWFRPAEGGPDGHPRIFMATGTGVAPFLSALRTFPTLTPLACCYGVRLRQEAVAAEELAARCPLRLAISREAVDSPHHHGRITDFLDDLPRDPDVHYYLCGLDAMIEQASTWLEEHGVPFTHVHREVFFNA